MQYWMRSPACPWFVVSACAVFVVHIGALARTVSLQQIPIETADRTKEPCQVYKLPTSFPPQIHRITISLRFREYICTFSAARPIWRSQVRATSVVASVALRERKALWSQSCRVLGCVYVYVCESERSHVGFWVIGCFRTNIDRLRACS